MRAVSCALLNAQSCAPLEQLQFHGSAAVNIVDLHQTGGDFQKFSPIIQIQRSENTLLAPINHRNDFADNVAAFVCCFELVTPPIGGGNPARDETFFRQSIKNFDKCRLVERNHVAERHLIDAGLAFNDVQCSVLHRCQAKVGGFLKKNCNRYLIEPAGSDVLRGNKKDPGSFRLSGRTRDLYALSVTITALTLATIIAALIVGTGEARQEFAARPHASA